MHEDIITLISRDGKDKIVCYKYMEECFKKEGYILPQRHDVIEMTNNRFREEAISSSRTPAS